MKDGKTKADLLKDLTLLEFIKSKLLSKNHIWLGVKKSKPVCGWFQ